LLVVSLVVAVALVVQASRQGPPRTLRVTWLLSAVTTSVLVAWSLIEFGP